jgi:UDP-glucose 4-epimerase
MDVVGFSSRTLDLRRAESLCALEGLLDGDTTLIFAAAITREKGNNLEIFLDNVRMAGHASDFLESHPPAKFVYLSSDAVYAMQTDPITEDTPVAPEGTLYGIAKDTAECLFRRSAWARGIPLLVLRPTGVFGPGDTHNSYGPNAFVRSIVASRTVQLFGEGEERRDHLYIDDLVRLVALLLDREALGVYDIATGMSHSFKEVAESLRRVVPLEFTVTHLPRKAPVTHRQFNISRLSREVPKFQFTDLKQGLQETFASFAQALRRA